MAREEGISEEEADSNRAWNARVAPLRELCPEDFGGLVGSDGPVASGDRLPLNRFSDVRLPHQVLRLSLSHHK